MYTKKKCKIYVLSVLLCTFFFSCSSIDFELPQGPQGTNGKSAYEIWKEEVETGHINWPSTLGQHFPHSKNVRSEEHTSELQSH